MLDFNNPCFQSVHLAVKNSIEKYEKYNINYKNNSRLTFVKEALTYRIGFPRQSGHTTSLSISSFYQELLPCLICIPHERMYNNIKSELFPHFNPSFFNIISFKGDNFLNIMRGRNLDMKSIWVDCSALMSKEKEDKIFELASMCFNLKLLMFLE
jgi:hypothetical protein